MVIDIAQTIETQTMCYRASSQVGELLNVLQSSVWNGCEVGIISETYNSSLGNVMHICDPHLHYVSACLVKFKS